MDKKVKVAVIVLIIVIIMVTAVITAYYVMDTKNKEKNDITNNLVENVVYNDQVNTLDETENLDKVEDEQTSTTTTVPNDNIISGSEEDLVEKAIEIVKEDWGEDNTVYFDYAGIDNEGRYVISVNDSQTTQVLQWYNVNTTTEQFFKQ